jgi:hypothetical protein
MLAASAEEPVFIAIRSSVGVLREPLTGERAVKTKSACAARHRHPPDTGCGSSVKARSSLFMAIPEDFIFPEYRKYSRMQAMSDAAMFQVAIRPGMQQISL